MGIPHKLAKQFFTIAFTILATLPSKGATGLEPVYPYQDGVYASQVRARNQILNYSVQVQEAFYNYDRSYQILAVGTHAKSARDLIMLR